MKLPVSFHINVNEKFPRLSRAPIVEAVIQWQATPTLPLEQANLLDVLKTRFPEFKCETLHEVEAAFAGSPQGMELRHRSQWNGFRLTSHDQKHVCQFKPNTVVFSRLAPYEDWGQLTQASQPFWNAFRELAAPIMIDRVSVRFISEVKLNEGEDVADYVTQPPSPLNSLGLVADSFFHKDSAATLGHAYKLNVVQTIQPAQPPLTTQRSLIVDIDIFTTEPIAIDVVDSKLSELRFIKNKVFFSVMKDAEEKFN